jgi:hypothetical protein
MTYGIKFVRKANMWTFYICHNTKGRPDTHEFFATEEEASKRLKEYDNGQSTNTV